MEEIREQLQILASPAYRQFHCRLMPTVDPDCVFGIPVPSLRKYAAQLYGTPQAEQFLSQLPHYYYEENNLHAFLLERISDFDCCVEQIDRFLPYVDNWATCDSMSPKCFARNLPRLLPFLQKWLSDSKPYSVRYALKTLMNLYLGDAFEPRFLEWAAQVSFDEYYVKMAQAWLFATALAKQEEATLPYFTQGRLEPFVWKKGIRKAIESRRISPQQKERLRRLRQGNPPQFT